MLILQLLYCAGRKLLLLSWFVYKHMFKIGSSNLSETNLKALLDFVNSHYQLGIPFLLTSWLNKQYVCLAILKRSQNTGEFSILDGLCKVLPMFMTMPKPSPSDVRSVHNQSHSLLFCTYTITVPLNFWENPAADQARPEVTVTLWKKNED